MHKRNVSGLKEFAKKKHEKSLEKAKEAIRKLQADGLPVNFSSVARTADVSTSWLYGQEYLVKKIKSLREKTTGIVVKDSQKASDESKIAIIKTLKEQNRGLRKENSDLKRQLSVAYGQIERLMSK